MAQRVSAALDLGDIRDLGLDARLRRLPEAVESLTVLTHHQNKRSSEGSCGDCPVLEDCVVCPLSICHGDDPTRVPDFVCAFNRLAAEASVDFHLRAGLVSAGDESES
jgi:hypothetical protein